MDRSRDIRHEYRRAPGTMCAVSPIVVIGPPPLRFPLLHNPQSETRSVSKAYCALIFPVGLPTPPSKQLARFTTAGIFFWSPMLATLIATICLGTSCQDRVLGDMGSMECAVHGQMVVSDYIQKNEPGASLARWKCLVGKKVREL
jgi:hypothetical protein